MLEILFAVIVLTPRLYCLLHQAHCFLITVTVKVSSGLYNLQVQVIVIINGINDSCSVQNSSAFLYRGNYSNHQQNYEALLKPF